MNCCGGFQAVNWFRFRAWISGLRLPLLAQFIQKDFNHQYDNVPMARILPKLVAIAPADAGSKLCRGWVVSSEQDADLPKVHTPNWRLFRQLEVV